MTYETRAVLGAAYKHDRTAYLTHLVELNAEGEEIRVMCNRVKLEHLADPLAIPTGSMPTCHKCRVRWRNLNRGFLENKS